MSFGCAATLAICVVCLAILCTSQVTVSDSIPIVRAKLDPFQTPTSRPTSSIDSNDDLWVASSPSASLRARCGDGDCTFGATATTLQAATVTSTILSITSVPCYITTFITDSTTVVSTVYSTETITSTVTSMGTVYVIEYAPTPIIMSSVYESTTDIVFTLTSYWAEDEGVKSLSTSLEGGEWTTANAAATGTTAFGDGWTADGDGQGGEESIDESMATLTAAGTTSSSLGGSDETVNWSGGEPKLSLFVGRGKMAITAASLGMVLLIEVTRL